MSILLTTEGKVDIMAGIIFALVIYLLVVAIMLGIGISQYRSKSPVGFYSGEKPPMESELTDVDAWNKKHGKMWIWYGVIIIISYLAGIPFLVIDSVWCILPMCGGIMVPLPFMIRYHHKLVEAYKRF